MSRPRVITGTDERGRPVATWADPPPETGLRYGFMEPATAGAVERRQATPEEMAAARAREAQPSHLTTDNARSLPFGATAGPTDAGRTQASRQRGAERHVEVVAGGLLKAARPLPALYPPAPKPSPAIEEESAVPEDVSKAAHFMTTSIIDPVADTLAILGDAVVEAIEAQAERTAAELRWACARAALHAAYVALDAPPDEGVEPELDQAIRQAAGPSAGHVDIPAIAETLRTVEPPAIGGGSAKRPYTRPRVADLPLTPHQEKVLAAVVRARGDRKAVAVEFGFKAYQSVDETLEVAGKKGRLPIDLIPLLPARFAKYTGL